MRVRTIRASSALWLAGLASCAASGDRVVEFGPAHDLFRPYIADPRRARIGFTVTEVVESDVVDDFGFGDSRFGLKAGERAGLFRVHPRGEPDRGWQLDLEGGYRGESDRDHNEDVIGWDGVYGLQVAWRRSEQSAWRSGILHTSSHLGDEIDINGNDPRSVTREDLFFAYSRDLDQNWRAYVEAGYAIHVSDADLLDPWRFEAGAEYEPKPQWVNGRLGWYSALDVTSFEENDWTLNANWQTGLAWPVHNDHRVWRFGVEVYTGRSQMGEFFEERETWVSLGIWL